MNDISIKVLIFYDCQYRFYVCQDLYADFYKMYVKTFVINMGGGMSLYEILPAWCFFGSSPPWGFLDLFTICLGSP